MSREDAEKLDKRIRNLAGATKSQLDTLGALVAKAKAGRIHEALDYPSWTAYLGDALRELCSGEGIQARREVVTYLYDAGMPQRAIAAATGVNQSTISRDVMHDASPESAPDPDEHEFPNGGTANAFNPPADGETEGPDDERDPRAAPTEPKPRAGTKTKAKTTTGRDGKTYPRKRPTPDVPQPSRHSEPLPRTIAMRKANTNLGAIEAALGRLDEAVTVLQDVGIIDQQDLSERLVNISTRLLDIKNRITLAVTTGERITDTIRSGEDGDDA